MGIFLFGEDGCKLEMDGCQLKLGDCHELIQSVPDASVDLVYTDPPFDVTGEPWDAKLQWGVLWPHIWRVLKPGGNVVIHTAGKFTFSVAYSQEKQLRYRWFWVKVTGNRDKETGYPILAHTNHLQSGTEPLRCVEEILVFNMKRRSSTYHPQPPQLGSGSVPHHCIFYQPRPGACTRPVELASMLVSTYSNEGDTVLDICMSDGMTGIACRLTGRRFIGFDCYLPHFQLAVKNLQQPKSRNVELLWMDDTSQFMLRWHLNGKLQTRCIAVPSLQEKESVEKRVRQLQQELEANPALKPKLPRSTNTLGLRDIHPYVTNKGTLQLKVCLGTYKDKNDHNRKKKRTITVQDGLEQCALAQAVQLHAQHHKTPAQVYDEESTIRCLLDFKRQRVE